MKLNIYLFASEVTNEWGLGWWDGSGKKEGEGVEKKREKKKGKEEG